MRLLSVYVRFWRGRNKKIYTYLAWQEYLQYKHTQRSREKKKKNEANIVKYNSVDVINHFLASSSPDGTAVVVVVCWYNCWCSPYIYCAGIRIRTTRVKDTDVVCVDEPENEPLSPTCASIETH